MPPKISIVIPTYNRCALLMGCLNSLEKQSVSHQDFEVIVVVDGSTDESINQLKNYSPTYSFKYLQQINKGPSTARNNGYSNANSELILFLDDDMITSFTFIHAHLEAHKDTANVLIQGRIEIHESVKRTPFIKYDEALFKSYQNELSRTSEAVSSDDVAGGNISIQKSILEFVGGFNVNMPGFRNTDGELAYRLEQKNIPIQFCNNAISYMTHVKDFDESMKGSYSYGRSYVYTQTQYPETIWKFSPAANDRRSIVRNFMRHNFYFRQHQLWDIDWIPKLYYRLVGISEKIGLKPISKSLYRLSKDYNFWKGVFDEAKGRIDDFVPKKIPILCYHNVSDVPNKAFRLYVLPVSKFEKQINWLKKNEYQTISLDDLYAYLTTGDPIPPKSIIITFDDGYAELKKTATPNLVSEGFHHIHFINSGKTGKTTDWVEKAPDLPILSDNDIKEMLKVHGDLVDFQAHGVNHLSCEKLENDAVLQEVEDCIKTLESVANRPIWYMAYPYGEYRKETPMIMKTLPLRCSFTVDQGRCKPGQNLHLLPRTEVFTNDFFIDFIFKVKYGWSPIASTRSKIKLTLKKLFYLIHP